MNQKTLQTLLRPRSIVMVLAALVLAIMAIISSESVRDTLSGKGDTPPKIEFTWTPEGPADLRQLRATLRITDDNAIDFTTYRMHLVELDRTLDMPIPGLTGRAYEDENVSFSLVADDLDQVDAKTLTVEISVADDKGQISTLTRAIELKR